VYWPPVPNDVSVTVTTCWDPAKQSLWYGISRMKREIPNQNFCSQAIAFLHLTYDESSSTCHLPLVESTQQGQSILLTSIEWHQSNGHMDGRGPSELIIWLGTFRIKCGIPNQITCSQALVLPSSTKDEIRLNLSATTIIKLHRKNTPSFLWCGVDHVCQMM